METSTQIGCLTEADIPNPSKPHPTVVDLVRRNVGADARSERIRDHRQKRTVSRAVIEQCGLPVDTDERHGGTKPSPMAECDSFRAALELLG